MPCEFGSGRFALAQRFLATLQGAVFAGSYGGHFRAYDPATGRIIWDVGTGTYPIRALNGRMVFGGVMDGGSPTIAGGIVYVHSGYAGRLGATAGRDMRSADGNVLMAFSVDGKQSTERGAFEASLKTRRFGGRPRPRGRDWAGNGRCLWRRSSHSIAPWP